MHGCMAVILLASQGHNRMTPMTEVLQWKDKGSLERAGKADEEALYECLHSMPMSIWNAWSFAW